MNDPFTTEKYTAKSRQAISDKGLQGALASVQERLGPATQKMYINQAEGPGIRHQAHEIRQRCIENLDILLEMLAEKVTENGGQVFFARDAADAVSYCLAVAKKHGVKTVVKGKSMVTEEVVLNQALEAEGIDVAETATIVMKIHPHQGRAVSLVPAVHVAVITIDQVLFNLTELYAVLDNEKNMPETGLTHHMVFISGPRKQLISN